MGAIFEAALDVLVRRWRSLLLLALVFAGPGALLTASAGLRFNSVVLDVLPDIGDGVWTDTPMLTEAQFERLTGALAAYLVATLVAGLLGSIGAVAMSVVALAGRTGPGADLGSALRACLRRTPSVLVFMLVTGGLILAIGMAGLLAMSLSVSLLSSGPVARGGPGVFLALVIGVALVVTVAYLTVRWALAFPVMALEAAGWRTALARTWRLSRDHVWRTFVVVLTGSLATVVVAALISRLAVIVIVDLLAVPTGLDPSVAESLALAVGTVLLAPLSPLLLAVLYLDLRLRHEGSGHPARQRGAPARR